MPSFTGSMEIKLMSRTKEKRELTEDELNHVSGGKAGGDPIKYMEFKLKEVLISSVTPSS
jgi:bacteriocin-like protein